MTTDQTLTEALRAIVGAGHIFTDEQHKAPFLTDWRGRYHGAALAVVSPATTAETAQVVSLCAAAGVAIVPQGGNTGLCGGATPLPQGRSVVVSLSRMKRIRVADPANDALIVEAGCTLAQAQAAAAAVERLFPLSLASEGSCEIGGNISTNAGGVQVLRYGNMRDLVLGLEVVLPDGRVWDGLRTLRKDNTGFDLKQCFIGAEGTLGIITAAALKLFPLPRRRALAWVAVPSPAQAVAMLGALRAVCGDRVSAFELIGRQALTLVLKHIPGAQGLFAETPDWSVLVELSDTVDDPALDQLLEIALASTLESGLALDAVVAASLAQAEALWALRENISEAQRIEGISVKHDISVPISRIADFLHEVDAALLARWPQARIVAFGHIGDGNLHYNVSAAAGDNDALIAQGGEVNRLVYDLVDRFDGSISAEHGLGQLKRDEIRRYRSPVELELMARLKAALDPQGLMNPGKVL